jgi:hypothetical protein
MKNVTTKLDMVSLDIFDGSAALERCKECVAVNSDKFQRK